MTMKHAERDKKIINTEKLVKELDEKLPELLANLNLKHQKRLDTYKANQKDKFKKLEAAHKESFDGHVKQTVDLLNKMETRYLQIVNQQNLKFNRLETDHLALVEKAASNWFLRLCLGIKKPTPEETPNEFLFCPGDCPCLSPHEKDQDDKTVPHECSKFNVLVVHGEAHPQIYRVPVCKIPAEDLVPAPEVEDEKQS